MKSLKTLIAIIFLLSLNSCSDDDKMDQKQCLSEDFEITETNTNIASSENQIIITLDVTNNSSLEYSLPDSKLIIANITVTTVDGKKFETIDFLSIGQSTLSPGATANGVIITANYAENKTYSSHEISLSCL